MASPNSKNSQEDTASDGSSALSTGSSPSDYSGSTLSSFATASTPSYRSRRESRSPRSTSLRSRRFSSGSRSSSSCRSDVSDRNQSPRKRLFSRRIKKSPKKAVRPIGEISMLKHPLKTDVRSFLCQYSKAPDFEAFSLSVDGIPFVALSLMNADKELLEQFQVPPPTPMKKHTPGVNRPRKRSHSLQSRSSIGSKHVSFADEESPPKKSKRSVSDGGLEAPVEPDSQ